MSNGSDYYYYIYIYIYVIILNFDVSSTLVPLDNKFSVELI